jgi:hypothetical protein
MPSVHVIELPEVEESAPPEEHAAVGPELDRRCAAIVRTAATGVRTIGIRGLSLIDHPGWSAAALAEMIIRTGTDRYEPERLLPFTAGYNALGVDLHVEPAMIEGTGLRALRHPESVCGRMLYDFQVGPPVDRGGRPLRIDVITVYDIDRLVSVPVPYDDGHVDRLTSYGLGPDPPSAVVAVLILDRAP